MSKTLVKTFVGINPGDIETKVGLWLVENSVKVIAASQSQSSDFNLTIFYEDVGKTPV